VDLGYYSPALLTVNINCILFAKELAAHANRARRHGKRYPSGTGT